MPGAPPVMFWVLFLMGTATLAPCLIVPHWQDYKAIKLAEQLERYALGQVHEQIAREERNLEALRTDPAVVARVAQRELAYSRPGEQVVRLAVAPASATDYTPPVLEEVRPPAAVARVLGWLPSTDLVAVYGDSSSRAMIQWLSVGLMGGALVLFRPRRGAG